MSANVGEETSPFVDQLADGPGVSRIDPSDPAAPMYRLLALMRSPVALRDLMIQPVRTGYIGQEKPIDPALLPKSAAELSIFAFPNWTFPRHWAAFAARFSARPAWLRGAR
jgi:hypothetical protein